MIAVLTTTRAALPGLAARWSRVVKVKSGSGLVLLPIVLDAGHPPDSIQVKQADWSVSFSDTPEEANAFARLVWDDPRVVLVEPETTERGRR